MKKQIAFGLFLVAGIITMFSFRHESPGHKYLTLTFSPGNWLTIVNEQGVQKYIDLGPIGNENNEKWIANAQNQLTIQLNELGATGYKLISSSGVWTGGTVATSIIYIFEKE